MFITILNNEHPNLYDSWFEFLFPLNSRFSRLYFNFRLFPYFPDFPVSRHSVTCTYNMLMLIMVAYTKTVLFFNYKVCMAHVYARNGQHRQFNGHGSRKVDAYYAANESVNNQVRSINYENKKY